jgi:hypothetical protein
MGWERPSPEIFVDFVFLWSNPWARGSPYPRPLRRLPAAGWCARRKGSLATEIQSLAEGSVNIRAFLSASVPP